MASDEGVEGVRTTTTATAVLRINPNKITLIRRPSGWREVTLRRSSGWRDVSCTPARVVDLSRVTIIMRYTMRYDTIIRGIRVIRGY